MSARVSLAVLGPSTRVLSTLCSTCPFHPAGCCHAPPNYDLADVARVLQSDGGRAFLQAALAKGAIVPDGRVLKLRRYKRRIVAGSTEFVSARRSAESENDVGTKPTAASRVSACEQLGPRGCTLDHRYRPATCNYYVCRPGLTDPQAPEDPAKSYLLLREWWTRVNRAFDAAFPNLPDSWWNDESLFDAFVAFLNGYERVAGLPPKSAQGSIRPSEARGTVEPALKGSSTDSQNRV